LAVIYFPPACGLILPECLVGGRAVRTLWIRACRLPMGCAELTVALDAVPGLHTSGTLAGVVAGSWVFFYAGFFLALREHRITLYGARDHSITEEINPEPWMFASRVRLIHICYNSSRCCRLAALKVQTPSDAISHPMLLIHLQLSHPFPVLTTQPPKPEHPQPHLSPT
jgi:hypothetical protein